MPLATLIKTFIISMTPIGELRAGIPYGISHGAPIWITFVIAVLGNMVPVFFLLWFLPLFERVMGIHLSLTEPESHPLKTTKNKFILRPYIWFRKRTMKKYTKRFEKIGALALITFVAVPLPITGAWTGSLAAFIFAIPRRIAIPLIFVGVCLAGIIVTIIAFGII